MSLSVFCTSALLDMVGKDFEKVVQEWISAGKRQAIHLVFLDPCIANYPDVSWQKTYGTIPEGKEFARFAKEKAELSFRHRMSTKDIWVTRPWLLQLGDVAYYGGVFKDGICVGISGLKEDSNHDLAEIFVQMLIKAITGEVAKMNRKMIPAPHLGDLN